MQQMIWEYELAITDRQTVRLPDGASILSVGNQRGKLCLWGMVNVTTFALVDRDIEIIGTGQTMPEGNHSFIGTVVIEPFVWHVFERVDSATSTARTAWEQARVELLKRINEELADKPEGEQSIWCLDAEDGDMTEFPTMLRVIDGIMGAHPMDWDRLLK